MAQTHGEIFENMNFVSFIYDSTIWVYHILFIVIEKQLYYLKFSQMHWYYESGKHEESIIESAIFYICCVYLTPKHKI